MSKTHTIAFRVSDQVRNELASLAHINGLTISEVVRTMVEADLQARADYFRDGAQ